MNRENIFFLPDGSPSTFSRDDTLKDLPLPKLDDTLVKYYRNLLPFGTERELSNSRKIINDFKAGVGRKLHDMLAAKAGRNWVNKIKCQTKLFSLLIRSFERFFFVQMSN